MKCRLSQRRHHRRNNWNILLQSHSLPRSKSNTNLPYHRCYRVLLLIPLLRAPLRITLLVHELRRSGRCGRLRILKILPQILVLGLTTLLQNVLPWSVLTIHQLRRPKGLWQKWRAVGLPGHRGGWHKSPLRPSLKPRGPEYC
jgi:hypothetical protein